MPLWKNTQHAFTAGQLDTHVMGRQDMDRYFKGATLLKNFLVKRQGCISKRRGTDLTADLDGLLGETYAGVPITPDKMRLVPVTNGDDGRYVILSGGIGFVANRDGVMMSDLSHKRRISPYTATDADGKPIIVTGNDARYSTATPVDVIHRISAGNYVVTRYADTLDGSGNVTSSALQNAFNAAQDGDTVRLHCNIVIKSAVTVTRSNSWTTDGGASATVTWNADSTNHLRQYKIVTGGTTYWSNETDYYGNRSTLTFERNGETVTVTEAEKHVTLDLYGYKITQKSNYGLLVRPASVSLTVDSSRVGAQFAILGPGNETFLFCVDSQSTGVLSGSLRLKGDIDYDVLAGQNGSMVVLAYDTTSIVIDEGKFETHDLRHGIVKLVGGPLVINGGTFTNKVTGNAKVQLIYMGHNTGTAQDSTATVNGGDFTNLNSYEGSSGNSSYVFCNNPGKIFINGGRFKFASSNNFCMYKDRRGNSFWRNGLMILRGEFSRPRLMNTYSEGGVYNEYTPDMYTGDAGDTSSKTATEITFARLGITATSSAWTLSDAGSLTFEWNASNSSWHIFGTRSTGGSVNEYASGNPADTEVTFTTSGITATRTWSFSDGGHWRIGYAGSYWWITTSVLNDAQPNADGYYGVKVQGEADYKWTGGAWSAGTPYRFAVPYSDADLADLCIRQSGDTLFVAHREYPPAKIYFDSHGRALFEELTFDNTDHKQPVIDSAVMVGNDPEETDWPSEFPYRNGSSWVTTGVPSWLSAITDTVSLNGSSKTPLAHLEDFIDACKALGTVTDAGYSGNDAEGDDDSYSRACSFTCTSVKKDYSTGKKTTTVSVISFTTSKTIEKTTTYTDGLATGCDEDEIVTVGVASNSASAASVIVTRTVKYAATYVRNGKESRPSTPVSVNYDMPWANNAVVNITLSKGSNTEEPEYYNLYKDNGNGYGLIATVGVDKIVGGISGSVNTYPLFMPDNTLAAGALVCAADYEEKKGWSAGDILRKMVSTGKDSFTSSPANDICLVNTASNAANGIQIDLNGNPMFKRVRVLLDGRIYDKTSDASYIIVSTNRVTCTLTYSNADGTTGTLTKTMSSAQGYSWGGIAGGVYIGIYEDWASLPRKSFTAPNGDTVYGWLYGKGHCADDFNAHLRLIDFDFTSDIAGISGFSGVKSVKFTFSTSVYDYWTNNQQGCIHAVHFYSGSSSADAGIVQDDYINPDMTVTPPDDSEDAHFSAAADYPGCVGIYEQRLVFASSISSPSTLWMSRIADLYNFTTHESIREDDALELTLAATEFPNINHLVMGRDLMLFGDGGEWLISPVSGNALTYKTASAKLQSMIGSDRKLQPLQLADETLFAERGGTCLRSINYNYTSDSYQSNDLSVIAQSIFRANPIVSMAYKQHPDSIVECVLADGRIGTLVYMKEQEVAAWSVQELGGGWKAREIVTPKCIISGTTEMMILVEKDGVYQLWKVRDDNDELTDACQVVLDGLHVETSSEPTGTGEVGVALGDGTYAIGWPVVSEFVSVRPEPERGATAQMEIKNATESELRVIDASTFSVKPYAIEAGWRQVALPVSRAASAVTLAEKDCKRLLTGTNNRDGRIHVRHAEPWPLTILSISNTYQIEYENEEGKGDGQ